MGSPSCIFVFGDGADADDVDWVRILLYNNDGDEDDRESKDMREDSDEDDSSPRPRRGNSLFKLQVVMERDLVTVLLVVVFAETRAMHLLMARDAPVDIILLGS
jgi:hypothetical protein